MPSEGGFTAMSSEFDITLTSRKDGWLVPNVDKAWCLGIACRWLGYNVTMRYEGKERIGNWASNASSIAVRPFQVSGPDVTPVHITSIGPRDKTFAPLPGLGSTVAKWRVSVQVTDAISMSTVLGNTAITGYFTRPSAKDVDIILPSSQYVMAVPVTLRATARAEPNVAGFQVVLPFTGHHPADPAPLSGPGAQEREMGDDEVSPGDGSAPDV